VGGGPAAGCPLRLEAHESADIGLMLLTPTALAEPGFEPRHANHPYRPAGLWV